MGQNSGDAGRDETKRAVLSCCPSLRPSPTPIRAITNKHTLLPKCTSLEDDHNFTTFLDFLQLRTKLLDFADPTITQ